MDFEENLLIWEITQHEANSIYNLLDEIRKRISSGEKITHSFYESSVNEILKNRLWTDNRTTSEDFIKECAIKGRYREVYKHLYTGMAKHDEIINSLK